MNLEKIDIRAISLDELRVKFAELGEKPFRANQVYEWLWNKSSTDFSRMTNISLRLRNVLNEHFTIRPARLDGSQYSADKTIKSAFRLYDDHIIEGVLIPRKNRMTACVSSQAGCSLSCKFCATGYLERKRNLEPGEIYDQVVLINRLAREKYDSPLTNIVFMGMGEPLLNYNNVMEGIRLITSEEGLNMSAKRITLSTAGISKMIRKLADDNVKFKLAVSLHAANDVKRNRIMPINETNSLKSLSEALQDFFHATRSRITFEYIVFRDFNDSPEDAEELYQFVRKIPCKINIIEYNPIREAKFENSSADRIEYLAKYLEMKEITVKIRRSRGKDIDAACGQLAGRR
ncbi:MAG TPA: 23S rRNA (adenine(2503)-C(2))-methyltransferase RlmN [Cyclobacteriaceae bacterium]|nr:23S rRNA (adenine(2503)-C(2))-methyltransferase RlmN [Cyclobacteriaceae bacterium]